MMPHLNYDDTNITYTPGNSASGPASDHCGQSTSIIHHFLALPDRLSRVAFRQHSMLDRLGKFLLVGATGVLVNSLALLLLYQGLHLSLIVASALAVELAIINNFIWNNRWTFGRIHFSCNRFVRFNLVSLAGLLISTCTLWILVSHMGLYYLVANLLGISLATIWNFTASSLWAWGGNR